MLASTRGEAGITLASLFERFPVGHGEAIFEGGRWSVTHAVGADGQRHSLVAEQLGGTGVVSANLYATATGEHLKPCEMPAARVLEFLRDARPLR